MRRIFILCMSLAMSAFAFNNCAYPDWEPESSAGVGDDNSICALRKGVRIPSEAVRACSHKASEGILP